MTAIQDILRVGVAAQAVGLLGKNIALAKKKKVTTKDILSTGMTNIVGIPILGAQSQLIGSIV